jgi:hypothetical protein
MLLSVCQICFIPGFIFYILLNRNIIDSKVLLIPVFSFALSLIINYILVTALSYFHIYTRLALIILILTEFAVLAFLVVLGRINTERYNIKMNVAKAWQDIEILFPLRKSTYGLLQFVFFSFSSLLLVFLLVILILNAGRVFNAWDAVVSWNRWAVEFYNNRIPAGTYHYPQLIPANWSIAYVLAGYPLQFIPRAIMPLFLIFMVYSFIILGLKHRTIIYFLSSIFLYQTLMKFHWTDGDVDVPVAFFSILIYICLLLTEESDNEVDKKKYIILSLMFACGSAVTKQSGIFLLLIYPLLLLVMTRHALVWTYRKIAAFCGLYVGMIAIIVLPFYLYIEMAIRKGLETSEINVVTNDIYNGASYSERLMNACNLFTGAFSSKLLFLIGIILFLFSLGDKTFRILNLSIVIPYFSIWALFFSYDLRNFAIMFPYLSLGIGIGFDIILRKAKIIPYNG